MTELDKRRRLNESTKTRDIKRAKNDLERAAVEQEYKKIESESIREFEERVAWSGPPVYLDLILLPIDGIVTETMHQWVSLTCPSRSRICFTIASSSCTATKAGIELLDMAGEVLQPEPGAIMALADSEHFSADLIEHVVPGSTHMGNPG